MERLAKGYEERLAAREKVTIMPSTSNAVSTLASVFSKDFSVQSPVNGYDLVRNALLPSNDLECCDKQARVIERLFEAFESIS